MGITLHYRLGAEKSHVPMILDRAERYASNIQEELALKIGMSMKVVREHPYRMHVEIGGCEWLCFGFAGIKHWDEEGKKKGWNYESETLRDAFKDSDLKDEHMMWCSAFCKTQFAESIVEHKLVADILRMVASYCRYAEVSDEGDYYQTGVLENAAKAIGANGELIASITKQLTDLGYPEDTIITNQTKIKPRKK